jgi:C4-dicarboxylate-specific signal transduction histidine kinase
VQGDAGELNQVWTNLVDNAVDAMDGSGTLRMSAHADDHGVVVERHGGDITIDPGAGGTVVSVRRPFRSQVRRS